VILYRLARKPYAADLTGGGARKVGGRCNPPGTAAVYTAEHISLAVLEALVHLDKQDIPVDYVVMAMELGSDVRIRYTDVRSAFSDSVQALHPVIAVPSVIVPRERNYVLYPEVRGLNVAVAWTESFRFDPRLFPLPSNK